MKSKYSKVKITALTLTFVCATTAMVGATTLQYGDKGKSVTAVQQQLIKHGYNATDKNGVYGKETIGQFVCSNKIVAFQWMVS